MFQDIDQQHMQQIPQHSASRWCHLCHFKLYIPGWGRAIPLQGWSFTGGTKLWIHVSSPVTTQCGYKLKETETGDHPCCTVVCWCMKHSSGKHLIAGTHKFSKDLAVPQNSRHQKGDMKVTPEDPQIEHATVQNLVTTVMWYCGLCTPSLQSCKTSTMICYTEPPGKLRSDALCCKVSLEWVLWRMQCCFVVDEFHGLLCHPPHTWHKTSISWWLTLAANTFCPHNSVHNALDFQEIPAVQMGQYIQLPQVCSF
jgi:hypothetical protein